MTESERPPQCCSPSATASDNPGTANFAPAAATPSSVDGMALIPGGTFRMGSDADEGEPGDGEGPSRLVTLAPFWIDTCAVSNTRFAEFVAATGYETTAERAGWSFVFAGLLPDDFPPTRGVARAVHGARAFLCRGRLGYEVHP